jgi:hypothetical protein
MREVRAGWRAEHEELILEGENQLALRVHGLRRKELSGFRCVVKGPEQTEYVAEDSQTPFYTPGIASQDSQFLFPRYFRPKAPRVLPEGRYAIEWLATEYVDDDSVRGRPVLVARDRFFVSARGAFSDNPLVILPTFLQRRVKVLVGFVLATFVAAFIGFFGTQCGRDVQDSLLGRADRPRSVTDESADLKSPPTAPSPTPQETSSAGSLTKTDVVLFRPVTADLKIDPSFRVGPRRRGVGWCT